MPATEGQSAGGIYLCIDGVFVPVVTLSLAAKMLGYSRRHTRRLCDEGQLIALKSHGRWWVLERAVEIWPQTALLLVLGAS